MELVDMLRLERSASCVQVQVLFPVPDLKNILILQAELLVWQSRLKEMFVNPR